MSLLIEKSNLKAIKLLAKHFASRDGTRFVLQGVHLEPRPDGGVYAVAMDGRRMAWMSLEACGELAESVTLPRSLIDALKPGDVLTVEGDTAIAIEKSGIEKKQKLIDRNYPAWRKVIPEVWPEGMLKSTMNAALLGETLVATDSIVRAFFASKLQAVGCAITQDDESAPCAIVAKCGSVQVQAIVMPVRGYDIKPDTAQEGGGK